MPDVLQVPYQVDNPTRAQRHELLRYLLKVSNRPEDFDNIIRLLSPPPDILTIAPKNSGRNIKIGVIGAGEAGLASSFELRKIGCDITIFEASDRIGGRIYTHYFDRDKKYLAELGAMRISPSHETTWHYVDLFRLRTSPFVSKNNNALIYLRDARARNDPKGISVSRNIYPRFNLTPEERNTPWQELSGRITRKYLNPLPPEVRAELIQVKPVYSKPIVEIDTLNYREAYESVGLSENAIAMLGYLGMFEQSFFNLSLTEIMQENYTADFSFTYRINGGTIHLPHALYSALRDKLPWAYEGIGQTELGNVDIRCGNAVDGIFMAPNGSGIILQYRNTKTGETAYEKFDYVVCGIPFTSLRRTKIYPMFGVQKMQAIAELNYEPGQKTFMFLKERFWEMGTESQRIVGGGTATDLPNIAVYYPSDHAQPMPNSFNNWTLRPGASPEEPGVLLASYNWGQDAELLGRENTELLKMDITRFIREIHGLPLGYLEKNTLAWLSLLWSDVQYIWGGGALTKPQDKILFSYVSTLPEMNDRIFFAGEHISQKHVWQQGSFQTAMIAANDIAQRIKARRS